MANTWIRAFLMVSLLCANTAFPQELSPHQDIRTPCERLLLRGATPRPAPDAVAPGSFDSESTDDVVSGETVETGNALTISGAIDAWWVKWERLSVDPEYNTEASLIWTPEVSILYRNYSLNIAFPFGGPSSGEVFGFNSVERTSTSNLPGIALGAAKWKDNRRPIDLHITAGYFSGQANWSYIEDTIDFKTEYDTLDVNARLLSIEATFHLFSGGPIGLRYVNLHAPLYLQGNSTYTDPEDSDNSLVEADVSVTSIHHFFFVWDPLRALSQSIGRNDQQPRVQRLSLQGHFLTLLYGIGWASNRERGEVSTLSTAGVDLDIGLKYERTLVALTTVSVATGVRWLNWTISSASDGTPYELQVSDVYYGPYLELALTL